MLLNYVNYFFKILLKDRVFHETYIHTYYWFWFCLEKLKLNFFLISPVKLMAQNSGKILEIPGVGKCCDFVIILLVKQVDDAVSDLKDHKLSFILSCFEGHTVCICVSLNIPGSVILLFYKNTPLLPILNKYAKIQTQRFRYWHVKIYLVQYTLKYPRCTHDMF